MFRWSILVVVFIHSLALCGQGTIRGKVTDEQGETIIGATIVRKDQPAIGTTTDLDGNFSLKITPAGQVTIVVSFIGLEPKEATLDVGEGKVVIADFTLPPKRELLKEVVIEGRARRSSDTYLDRMKANAPGNIDFISRDVMLKTGDADAASAVKRVSGVSTIGAFITVRGLADRYLVTTVNGGRIPTLDPFTNNLRLDIFPTGLMDNIVITKTETPDLPCDWAGAYISMNTSDYPQRLQVGISTTIGINPNTTFQDVVSGGSGSRDWLGRDDGTRGIPEGIPDAVEDYPQFLEPGLYQQLGLLGLQPFLNQYGIVSSTPGFSGSGMNMNSTLHHLALTQLGLLPPALLFDPAAVQAGVNAYNNTYNLAYFSPLVNAEMAALNKKWDNSRWRVGTRQAAPNHNFSLTIGNQVELFKKKKTPKVLGFLLGMRYSTDTQYDGASTITRTIEDYEAENPGEGYKRKGEQRMTQTSFGWNAMGSMSLRLDRNNSISLMAMGNVLGQDNARFLIFLDPTINSETFASEEQFWEQRRLWVFQGGSRHFIPATKLTVNTDISYSTGDRDLLDLKTIQYEMPPPGEPITNVDGALTPPGRIFRFLKEDLVDARLGFELPMSENPALVRKLKFGGSYRWNRRTNDQRYYVVLNPPGPANWEEPGRFEMQEDGRIPSRYAPFGTFKDNDIGLLGVWAGYLMADHAISPRVRFAGGVRMERTELISDILRFWEEGVASDDPTRGTVGDLSINGAGAPEPKPAIPGMIDRWDILPSANLITKLRPEDKTPMNLRLSYFRSLGRPSFREFSAVQYYDYLFQAPVYGNPDLRMTQIDNADLRLEFFLPREGSFSVSAFYKYFIDHIELLQTAGGSFTWRNADRSEVRGLEFEGKFKPLRWLEWRGNVTLMDSRSFLRVVLNDEEVEYTTPMFGQSPYIVNSMLTYVADSLGLNLSVSYNVQGPRLAVTNAELDPTGIRAFEMPRHLVDITLNKRFAERWALTFRVRDLLNQPIRRSYQFEAGYLVDFDRYTYGTEYLLTVAYNIR